jgi:hypothetical protein
MVRATRRKSVSVRQNMRGAIRQGRYRGEYLVASLWALAKLWKITSRFDGVIKKLYYEADDTALVGKVRGYQKQDSLL